MAKITGSMNRDWISQVRRAPAAKRLISSVGKEAMQGAESSMQLEGASQGWSWRYYYGSAEQTGSHGRTFTYWATNDTSRSDTDAAFDAARAAGAISADEAKRNR